MFINMKASKHIMYYVNTFMQVTAMFTDVKMKFHIQSWVQRRMDLVVFVFFEILYNYFFSPVVAILDLVFSEI